MQVTHVTIIHQWNRQERPTRQTRCPVPVHSWLLSTTTFPSNETTVTVVTWSVILTPKSVLFISKFYFWSKLYLLVHRSEIVHRFLAPNSKAIGAKHRAKLYTALQRQRKGRHVSNIFSCGMINNAPNKLLDFFVLNSCIKLLKNEVLLYLCSIMLQLKYFLITQNGLSSLSQDQHFEIPVSLLLTFMNRLIRHKTPINQSINQSINNGLTKIQIYFLN